MALYLTIARVVTLIAKRPKVVYLALARVAPVIAKGSILPNSLKACRYNSEGHNGCFIQRSFVQVSQLLGEEGVELRSCKSQN